MKDVNLLGRSVYYLDDYQDSEGLTEYYVMAAIVHRL
jgi:hypothetical protein